MYHNSQLISINGMPQTRENVCVVEGVRCPHSVVDGDKPIAATGPRCGKCRETWYALERPNSWNGQTEYVCRWCREVLHKTYSMKNGKYEPHSLAHEAPNLDCLRNEYPIPGYEQNFNFYGWGRWEKYVATQWEIEQLKIDHKHRMETLYGITV